MFRKTNLISLGLALLLTVSACAKTPPAASSQPSTPEASSPNLPAISSPDEEPPVQFADEADFETLLNEDGTVTIKRYLGPGGDVVIPPEIDGKQVTAIGNIVGSVGAFEECTTITSVVIPDGVTEILDNAFYSCTALETATIPASVTLLRNCAFCNCPNLYAVYFAGDAPIHANYVFDSTENVTMYYQEGTSGWSNPWHGRPAEPYVPSPENTSTPEFLNDLGKTLHELKNEYPEGEFVVYVDGFPGSAAVCFGKPESEYAYLFFGTHSGDFEKALNECEEQLKCAGFVTTTNILFPDMEDNMSFQDFFSLIGVDDYEFLGEDTTAAGWLRFMYRGLEVMVNTNEPNPGGGWDFTGAEIVKRNARASVADPEILHINFELADAVMFD